MLKIFFYFLFFIYIRIDSSFIEIKRRFLERIKMPPASWMIKQINNDFNKAKKLGHSFKVTPKLLDWFEKAYLAVRYKIINNKVEISYSREMPDSNLVLDRIARMNDLIITLSKITPLSNVDIIVSLRDIIDEESDKIPGIIFAGSKNKYLDKNIILIPDFYTLHIYPNLLEKVKDGNSEYAWELKKNKAIWIGANTGGIYTKENYFEFPRFKIVDLSLKFKKLIYAKFSRICQLEESQELESILGNYLVDKIDIKDHLKYKYQVTLDGNGASYPRFYWQLFSNCLILKQNSDYIQWYYEALNKYKHYIPIKKDLSDLQEKIIWAKNNDDKVKEISENANNFALNNLKLEDNLYYLYLIIKKYSILQNKY